MRVNADLMPAAETWLWRVWHARECRYVSNCVWADDITMEWCEDRMPGHPVYRVVHKERRILIDMSARMVIIDPVGDDEKDVSFTDSKGVDVGQ